MESLLGFFFSIVDFIFPKHPLTVKLEAMRADELLETSENCQGLFLPTCSRNGNGLQEQPLSVFTYRNPLIRHAIWEMKYRGNKKIIKLLAKAMSDFIIEEISEEWQFLNKNRILLVPIPISSARRRLRGFNQMEKFAEALMETLPQDTFELSFGIIEKRIHTIAQTKTKNRKERLGNLKDCFEVADKSKIKGRVIILLDDVTTTGATLNEAAGALKKSGSCRIFPIAIAH